MRRILTVLVVLVVAVVGYDVNILTDRSTPSHQVIVAIPPGSTMADAAERLQAAGVAPARLLRLVARLEGKASEIQAGSLIFPEHESVDEVLSHLTTDAQRASVWITVPEGYTAVQIEQRLRDAHLLGADGFSAYAHAHSALVGGVQTRSLEGFLYPDTYLVSRDAHAADVAAEMLAEFQAHIPRDAAARAHKLGYTLPQVVTVASLIEREAQVEDERPLMAGVYYHRLGIGMPLEVDASLEYTMQSHETEIRGSDLRRDTAYNTYMHQGLPPTPIANPGLPAIVAALHPVSTPYLYYVYKGGGRHAFAKTYQEHQANITRYLR